MMKIQKDCSIDEKKKKPHRDTRKHESLYTKASGSCKNYVPEEDISVKPREMDAELTEASHLCMEKQWIYHLKRVNLPIQCLSILPSKTSLLLPSPSESAVEEIRTKFVVRGGHTFRASFHFSPQLRMLRQCNNTRL